MGYERMDGLCVVPIDDILGKMLYRSKFSHFILDLCVCLTVLPQEHPFFCSKVTIYIKIQSYPSD